MPSIPKFLVESIYAGNCVLWMGSRIGAVLDVPAWPEFLQAGLAAVDKSELQTLLRSRLAAGDLAGVLAQLETHGHGDALGAVLDEAEAQATQLDFAEDGEVFGAMPWRAVVCSVYPGVAARALAAHKGDIEIITPAVALGQLHSDVLTYAVVTARPTAGSLRSAATEFELVKELLRTRSLLLIGFSVQDPDFQQILDFLHLVESKAPRWVCLPASEAAPALHEPAFERAQVRVLVDANYGLGNWMQSLVRAQTDGEIVEAATTACHDAFEVAGAVGDLPLRLEHAMLRAAARPLPVCLTRRGQVDGEDPVFSRLDVDALLGVAGLLAGHQRFEEAQSILQTAYEQANDQPRLALAAYGQALLSSKLDQAEEAAEALQKALNHDPGVLPVPEALALEGLARWDGGEQVFACRGTAEEGGEALPLEAITVRIEGALNAERQRHFAAAAQRWSELEHPGLQPILQYFSDAKRAGVVGVRIPGPTLESYLVHHGGALALHDALELLAPVAQALASAHERGLYHGFVAPLTVVIAAEGAVLAGLALASLQQPVVSLIRERGAYFAPERVAGAPASAAGDVYALAALLWRTCFGCEPSVGATIDALHHDELAPLALALAQGLAQAPEHRPSADALWAATLAVLHGAPASASTSTAATATEPTPQPTLEAAASPDKGAARRSAASTNRSRRGRGRASGRLDDVNVSTAHEDTSSMVPSLASGLEELNEVSTAGQANASSSAQPSSAQAVTPVVPLPAVLPDPEDLAGWQAILAARPFDLRARQAIERIGERAQQQNEWDVLADVLLVRAEHTQVKSQRFALLRELAGVFATRLAVPAHAFDVLRSAIADAPENEVGAFCEELVARASEVEMWNELVESLTALSDRTGDRTTRARIYRHLAQVQHSRLNDLTAARSSLGLALELVPGDVESLTKCVTLDEALGDHAALVRSLAELALRQDARDGVATRLRQVELYRQHLGDAQAALAVLEEVLRSQPSHPQWLATAEELARTSGNNERLVEILRARAAGQTGLARAKLFEEVAAIELENGRVDQAAQAWSQILEESHDRQEWAARLVAQPQWKRLPSENPQVRELLVTAYDCLAEQSEAISAQAQAYIEAARLLDQTAATRGEALSRYEKAHALLATGEGLAQEVVVALASLYREAGRFAALEKLWREQAESDKADSFARVQAWSQLLEVYTSLMPDPTRRQHALEELVLLQPERSEWALALAQVHEDYGRKDEATALLSRLLDISENSEKVELLRRLYTLSRDESPEQAQRWLQELLAIAPESRSDWQELANLASELADWPTHLEAQVQAAQTLADPHRRHREVLSVVMAALDHARALVQARAILQELANDPNGPREAMAKLAGLYASDGASTEEATQATYDLARNWLARAQAEGATRSELAQAYRLWAHTARGLGKDEEARKALRQVSELEPGHAHTLAEQARLDLAAGDHAAALTGLRRLLTMPDVQSWSASERAAIHRDVAQCFEHSGQLEAALESVGQALRAAPRDQASLRLRLSLLEKRGLPIDVVKARLALVDALEDHLQADTADGAASKRIAEEIAWQRADAAKLLIDPLGRPSEAVSLLKRALEILPDDVGLMHRQLDASTAAEDWHTAVDVLQWLADQQSADEIRAKYYYTAGALLRDQAKDMARAAPWFEKTLELEPLHEKAFSALIGFHHDRGGWSSIARLISTRVAVLSDQARAEKMGLYEQLASIYERQLGDAKAALSAYEQGIRLSTAEQDVEVRAHRRRKVMGLTLQVYGEAGLDRAIGHGLALMAIKPLDVDVYRRVLELCQNAGRLEQAVSIARVLRFLKKANAEELRLAGPSDGPVPRAKTSLSRDHWRRHLCHAGEQPHVAELLGLIWPVIVARAGRTHGHLGLDRQKRTVVSASSRGVLGLFAQTCQTLDLALPDVYEQPSSPDGFVGTALSDRKNVYPTVLIGADVGHERRESVLAFRVGRVLARVRPEAVAVRVLPSPSSLRDAVAGAMLLAGTESELTSENREFAAVYAREIQRLLPPARLENLRIAVDRLASVGDFDAVEYIRGVEFTAARIGLLMSGSLEASAMALAQGRDETGLVPAQELVRDLIGFSVSDGYFQIREALGFSIADEIGLHELVMHPRRSSSPSPTL